MMFPPDLTDRQQLYAMAPMFAGCGFGVVTGYVVDTWWVALFPAVTLAAALYFWLQHRVVERQRAEVVAWLSSVFGPPLAGTTWLLNRGHRVMELRVCADGVIVELYNRPYVGSVLWPSIALGLFHRPLAALHKTVAAFYELENSPEETTP